MTSPGSGGLCIRFNLCSPSSKNASQSPVIGRRAEPCARSQQRRRPFRFAIGNRDRRGAPPMESGPRYNAAADLIERNLAAGRGAKTAFIDDRGQYTYAELARRVDRFANAARRLGLHHEQRILLCLHDGIDFPTAFLGAIKAGIVPVAVNTQLGAGRIRLYARPTAGRARSSCRRRYCRRCKRRWRCCPGPRAVSDRLRRRARNSARSPTCSPRHRPPPTTAPTHPDETCFWLYSSGSTGRPKGTVHRPFEPDRRPPNSMPSRCSASAKTTSSSRRQSCSSPMASATR